MRKKSDILNVKCDEAIYAALRADADSSGSTVRDITRLVIAGQLMSVKDALADAGLAEVAEPRLVRLSFDIDDNVKLREVAASLGLGAAPVILACLRRHFNLVRR